MPPLSDHHPLTLPQRRKHLSQCKLQYLRCLPGAMRTSLADKAELTTFKLVHCPGGQPAAPHCKENPIYEFLFWELRGLSTNFHINVYVSYLCIPRICPHISLQQNRQTDPGNL
jgi:hypothetical protein